VAFSAGGDGGGNPFELTLDGERPDPAAEQRAKESPGRAGASK